MSGFGSDCTILTLDNFETLVGSAPTLPLWLAQAPELRLLITSRERLNLHGETVIKIPQLTVPPGEELRREAWLALESYSAVKLFVQSAQRVDPRFRLDPTNRAGVVQICQLVGGLPLALEMAAAWINVLCCEQLAAQIAIQLDFLSTSYPNVPERQRSVRAVFEQSWQLLSKEEQRVLAALSLFTGTFSAEVAQAVADDSEAGKQPWVRLISNLMDKALLYRTPPNRFEIHPLVRRYAAEKLSEGGERARLQARHGRYYADLVGRPGGRGRREQLQAIETEIENVRTAWKWAVGTGQFQIVEQFLEGLFSFYDAKYWYKEGDVLFAEALQQLFGSASPAESHADKRRVELQTWLLIYRGLCNTHLHQSEQASTLLKQGVTLATTLETPTALAWAMMGLGYLTERWSLPEARLYFEQALTLCRELGHEGGQALCALQLGGYARERGEYHLARQFHEQNLLLCRRTGQQRVEAFELSNLGLINRMLGAYQAAFHYFQEALALARAIDHGGAESHALVQLIAIEGILEGYEHAERQFEVLCSLYQRYEQPITLGLAYLHLGSAALHHGYYGKAQTHLQQALMHFQKMEYTWGMAYTLPLLGKTSLVRGEVREAHRHLVEALQVAYATGSHINLLKALLGWAELLTVQGIRKRAAELLTFVYHHPATWHEDQQHASQLLGEITSDTPPPPALSAHTRGQALELERTAASLLADIGHPTVHHFMTSRESLSRSFRTLRQGAQILGRSRPER